MCGEEPDAGQLFGNCLRNVEQFHRGFAGEINMLDYYITTNVGNREVNEDSVGVYVADNNWVCFVCADGLGGHGKGEVASALAVNCAQELMKDTLDRGIFFDRYFRKVEDGLHEQRVRENAPNDFKTTAVVALTDSKVIQCAHIGDSRLYYFRKNRILFRTLDHSVPQMLVLAGEMKEKKIRKHPDRNRLLRVLGMNAEEVKFDRTEEIAVEQGDAILLCTDGFWELIDEKNMLKMLKKSRDAKEWGEMMQEIVQKNGKKTDMDNYSAICARL